MSDIFRDPILFIPVIAILIIFGAFYVSAMIWSYNRDAKKQGKKSGCLPVVMLALLICSLSLSITGCGKSHVQIMLKEDVISAAIDGFRKQYPNTFESYRPYQAELHNGIWQVYGTLPKPPGAIVVLGGTPEARIRDADGEVIRVYHTQ